MGFRAEIDAMDQDVAETLDGQRSVTYEPSTGGSYELEGLFTEAYNVQKPNLGEVDVAGPSVFLRRTEVAKLPIDPFDDQPRVTVDGVVFEGMAVPKDGVTGGARLIRLSRIA